MKWIIEFNQGNGHYYSHTTFNEENGIDLFVPSRVQAQKFDGKEESLNHDKYEYDWKKDEIAVDNFV